MNQSRAIFHLNWLGWNSAKYPGTVSHCGRLLAAGRSSSGSSGRAQTCPERVTRASQKRWAGHPLYDLPGERIHPVISKKARPVQTCWEKVVARADGFILANVDLSICSQLQRIQAARPVWCDRRSLKVSWSAKDGSEWNDISAR